MVAIYTVIYLMVMCGAIGYWQMNKKSRLITERIRSEEAPATEPRRRENIVERWERDASLAGLEIRARELILVALGGGAAAFIASILLTNSLLVALICSLMGIYAPKWYIKKEKEKRLILFNRQLERALMLAANTIRVGHGLNIAIKSIADMPEPLGYEFRRAEREISLGVSTEEALDRIQRRVNSAEFGLMVTAIKINREVGGNLITMFDLISETIRERQGMQSAVRAATTRGKASAYIVTAMPYGVMTLITIIEPNYLAPFLSGGAGRIIITGTVVMNVLGLWLINRLTKIEVE